MRKKKYTDDELFQMWVSLGEDRSIKQLAELTGYGTQTLNNKSSKGSWKVKLKGLTDEQEILVRAFVTDNEQAVAISEAVVYRGVSEKLLEVLSQSIQLLTPTGNPREIKTILDTYRLINGQPTDISKQQVETISQETLETLTDAELFGIQEDYLDRLMN